MIEIIINNNKYTFEKNITVLQACEQVNINVPRFCYHEKLSVAGNCRMCLVEIEKSPKPVASCAMPISPGMVIFTESPLVKKAREAILEFLLINHPLDCPICDQGGECDLQDITLNYGSDISRFFEIKHGVEDKECGPLIKTIMTRCIHCTRCVRFLSELAGVELFGALGRGENMEIGNYFNRYLNSEISGNLVDLCPVGAITSKPYAFLARNWELRKVESIDFSDGFGSNTVIHVRNFLNANSFNKSKILENDRILRILPKLNNNLNENWISDKARYSFDGNFFNRILNFEIKDSMTYQVVNWNNQNLTLLANYFKTNAVTKHFLGNLGSLIGVEELFFFSQFLKKLGTTSFLLENSFLNINKDLPSFYQFNSKFKLIDNADLILLIGTNPRFESSMLNLKIRKNFFNKEIPVYNIGLETSLTYPTISLGNSSKILLNICEGKHFFCKKILQAMTPIVIMGSSISNRSDYNVFQNLLRFLGKKSFLHLRNFNGLNFLHKNISQIHICELGLNLNSTNFLYKKLLWKNVNLKNTETIYYNYDSLNIWNKKTSLSKDLLMINTHQNNIQNKCKYILPNSSLYERDSLIINTEGFVQKNYKAITPNTNIRNGDDILKCLVKLNNSTSMLKFTNKYLFLEAPFLKNLQKNRQNFYVDYLNISQYCNKLNITPFKQIISNFYMTDQISNNSKIMAECSLFLKNKINFFN